MWEGIPERGIPFRTIRIRSSSVGSSPVKVERNLNTPAVKSRG